MQPLIPGIASLLLGMIAVITATYAVFTRSPFHAWNYLLLAGFCGLLVTQIFCVKCRIKKECVHILPGYLARFREEKQGPYTRADLLGTAILFALIILPPQVLLISSPGLFVLFWACIGFASVSSITFLCPGCGNQYCPFCRR